MRKAGREPRLKNRRSEQNHGREAAAGHSRGAAAHWRDSADITHVAVALGPGAFQRSGSASARRSGWRCRNLQRPSALSTFDIEAAPYWRGTAGEALPVYALVPVRSPARLAWQSCAGPGRLRGTGWLRQPWHAGARNRRFSAVRRRRDGRPGRRRAPPFMRPTACAVAGLAGKTRAGSSGQAEAAARHCSGRR